MNHSAVVALLIWRDIMPNCGMVANCQTVQYNYHLWYFTSTILGVFWESEHSHSSWQKPLCISVESIGKRNSLNFQE